MLTKSAYEYVSLTTRAQRASAAGAHLLVSLHNNAAFDESRPGSESGAQTYAQVPSAYRSDCASVSLGLAREILAELVKLGIKDSGVYQRIRTDYRYSDGSFMDYYGILRAPRVYGIPAVLVEHAFMDNRGDWDAYLATDDKLRTLAQADAAAIVRYYKLVPKEDAYAAVYNYDYYLANNPDVAATLGQNRAAVLDHFLHTGMAEQRQASANFSVTSYYNEYPDLRRQYGENWPLYYEHFMKYGQAEGRHGTGCESFVSGGPVAMLRLYNPNTGEHFYTGNPGEKAQLVKAGWRDEGIGWYAPEQGGSPVWRLYNPNAGDHHYTLSTGERDVLVHLGWKNEGRGWYSADSDGVPLYRQYNPNARTGSHNYSTSKGENNYLVRVGWRAEGIGWYGVRV